ncbi:MAG TPA: 3-hydroxyacyl-CoA dehydrogenase NAD-binding domain-containing protein [Steroidobacteraceae bacterium]|nr:3-hydroxyacyl-CoA dehydrogenase NAD-binding domain-containing protein [Steroidobacteraceae bacterium]
MATATSPSSDDSAIAVIHLDNPPVNALSHAVRQRLVSELTRAEDDPTIRAIILMGGDEFFSAGADVREFNTPKMTADPVLDAVISRFERCEKPTIAAVSGTCLGGGFELTLGCHFRVATAGAKVGLPEVKIGLIPGAGGTQRLPRVAGLETAVNMIVSGEPVAAADVAGSGLFDRIVESDLGGAARAFAREVITQGTPIRRIRDRPLNYPAHQAFLGFARNMVKAKAGPYPAPLACLDAIEAGLEAADFDSGKRREREIFLGLLQAVESRALRHVFFAERAAPKIPDVPADTPVRPINSIAVIGAGTMGGGIAMNFLNAGLPVTLLEANQAALDRGVATIRRNYEASARKGKLTPADLETRMGLLTPTVSYDSIRTADLVIEAVFEEIGVKESVFRQLDKVARPGAILATNTSTLDVNRIAAFTSRPGDVLGMHFFSPANVMRLLEVVRAERTAKDALATVMQLARKIRKLAIVAGVCDGFIGNRMLHKYSAQAWYLLEEGCLPAQVDRAMEKFGFAMGPFRVGDLAGNDIGWAIRKRRYAEKADPARPHIADRLCELGRFGQKTGAGWYDYRQGDRTPYPNADVEQMIVRFSREMGITRRQIDDTEIVERLVFSLVNEGARILEEKIAQRASDIDLVYLNGYGFPAWRGGPMFYADTVGLTMVIGAMHRYARGVHPEPWTPAPLLARLAAAGSTFSSLDS